MAMDDDDMTSTEGPADGGAVGGGSDRAAVTAFIDRERAFLQSLAGLVQEHAETVKGMAKSARQTPTPSARTGSSIPAATAATAGTGSTAGTTKPERKPEPDREPEPKAEREPESDARTGGPATTTEPEVTADETESPIRAEEASTSAPEPDAEAAAASPASTPRPASAR